MQWIVVKIGRIPRALSVRVDRTGLVLMLFITPCTSLAQTAVTASSSLDSTDFLIGDWIDVDVRLEHPEGASFTSLTGDTLGRFMVLEEKPIRPVSKEESVIGFRIAVYDTGLVTVPPFKFIYTLRGDSTKHEVSTQPLDLVIHSVPVDTTSDIKDVKPPVSMALTWREIVLPVAAIIVIAILLWLAIRYMRSRRRRVQVTVEEVETRPPHLVAMERLRSIEGKRLWQRGLLKPYYTEVTEVIRNYIDGRYGVPALEMTTEEILHRLESIKIPSHTRNDLEMMLSRSDLVKFAKYRALPEENEETLQRAFSVVEITAAIVEDQDGDGTEEKADHVSV